MGFSVEVNPAVPLVRVAGDMDVATVPELDAAIQKRLADGYLVLVLDLAGVTFLDSSGLGVLVSHHKTLRRQSGSLRIANASPRVLAVLSITGLDEVLALYPTVQAALEDD